MRDPDGRPVPAWLRAHGTGWTAGPPARVHDNPYFAVDAYDAVAPTGLSAAYWVHHQKNLAVGAIPLFPNGDIMLVGQWRFPFGSFSWELPEGGVPSGEAALAGAQRELRESLERLQPDLVHKIDNQVATARPQTGYGMTETCGIITSISGDFFVDKPDSAGPAMPTFEVKVVDEAGEAVPVGQIGELWVKGSPVIKGYINRPEATAEAITDGWLHTGDVARLDGDGFIYIVDRKKDMVLRGGENIFCAEVETCVHRLPEIAECCVFGVPDDRLGEEVGLAILLHPGKTLSAEAVRAHCAASLARHKIPRYIWFLEEAIPRNASGKFLKRDLRTSLAVAEAV